MTTTRSEKTGEPGLDTPAEQLLLKVGRHFRKREMSADLRTLHQVGGREADSFYRDRWSHDKVGSTHGVNCTGSCSWKVYVKDGIITWESQQTDYPSVGPDSPKYEPRGATFSWYTYSPTRIRYPYVRGTLLRLFREAKVRLTNAPAQQHTPVARPKSLLTGKDMKIRWSASWDDNLGGSPALTVDDPVLQRLAGNLTGHPHNYRETVAPYFRSVFYFSPDTSLIAAAPLGFQLHVEMAWLLFAVWPFTRLVHVFSAPVGYLTRPYIVYRSRATTAGARAPKRGWEPIAQPTARPSARR